MAHGRKIHPIVLFFLGCSYQRLWMAKDSSIGTNTETVMMPAPRIECDAQKYSLLGIRTMHSSLWAETPIIICLMHILSVWNGVNNCKVSLELAAFVNWSLQVSSRIATGKRELKGFDILYCYSTAIEFHTLKVQMMNAESSV